MEQTSDIWGKVSSYSPADKEFMAYQKDLKSLLKWFAQIVHTHPLALAECGVDKMLTTFLGRPGGISGAKRNIVFLSTWQRLDSP